MSAQQPSINSNNDFVQIYRPDPSRSQQQQAKLATKPTQRVPNTVIVVNQNAPYVRTNFEVNRSSAFYTTCQFCQQKVLTKSIQTFNCCTCLFCCCTGCLFYSIIQIIRGKDICCYDAIHRCPNCGQTICEYNSC